MNKIKFFEEYSLFNRAGTSVAYYYNPNTNKFELWDVQYEVEDDLVAAPYIESFKWLVRKKFFELLDEEETCLANSYSERRGYFQFLHETGLIYQYDQAMELAKPEMIEIWEAQNDLHIDWDFVDVE